MPWENIGSTATGEMPRDEAWILWSLTFAMEYIQLVCGDAPLGSKLDVMWSDHDLGAYPSLGVQFQGDPPWDYINRCEAALAVLNDAVSWHNLKQRYEQAAAEPRES